MKKFIDKKIPPQKEVLKPSETKRDSFERSSVFGLIFDFQNKNEEDFSSQTKKKKKVYISTPNGKFVKIIFLIYQKEVQVLNCLKNSEDIKKKVSSFYAIGIFITRIIDRDMFDLPRIDLKEEKPVNSPWSQITKNVLSSFVPDSKTLIKSIVPIQYQEKIFKKKMVNKKKEINKNNENIECSSMKKEKKKMCLKIQNNILKKCNSFSKIQISDRIGKSNHFRRKSCACHLCGLMDQKEKNLNFNIHKKFETEFQKKKKNLLNVNELHMKKESGFRARIQSQFFSKVYNKMHRSTLVPNFLQSPFGSRNDLEKFNNLKKTFHIPHKSKTKENANESKSISSEDISEKEDLTFSKNEFSTNMFLKNVYNIPKLNLANSTFRHMSPLSSTRIKTFSHRETQEKKSIKRSSHLKSLILNENSSYKRKINVNSFHEKSQIVNKIYVRNMKTLIENLEKKRKSKKKK